jgi:hypothetical protein
MIQNNMRWALGLVALIAAASLHSAQAAACTGEDTTNYINELTVRGKIKLLLQNMSLSTGLNAYY